MTASAVPVVYSELRYRQASMRSLRADCSTQCVNLDRPCLAVEAVEWVHMMHHDIFLFWIDNSVGDSEGYSCSFHFSNVTAAA